MSRKSKYSAEQKLSILNELTRSSISEIAKKYAVKITIKILRCLYKYHGIDSLRSTVVIQRNLNYFFPTVSKIRRVA